MKMIKFIIGLVILAVLALLVIAVFFPEVLQNIAIFNQ